MFRENIIPGTTGLEVKMSLFLSLTRYNRGVRESQVDGERERVPHPVLCTVKFAYDQVFNLKQSNKSDLEMMKM